MHLSYVWAVKRRLKKEMLGKTSLHKIYVSFHLQQLDSMFENKVNTNIDSRLVYIVNYALFRADQEI